ALRRAAILGEGWIPWQLGPDEFAALAARAGRLRTANGRSEPLELVAPLGVVSGAAADAVIAEAARWRAAGATAVHVGVGAGSLAEFLPRLEWFGSEVARRVE